MSDQGETNLSALIESTQDLIWSVDLDDRLVICNSAFRRYFWNTFGIQAELGMRPDDLLPPLDAGGWPRLYLQARTDGPFRIEFARPDGRTIELALYPILLDGKVTGVSVFGKDITVRKTAQKALQETERKYRAIFDGAVEGIFQTTIDGKVLTANRAVARMLGYDSPDELKSMVKDVGMDVWADAAERARYQQKLAERGEGAILGFETGFRRRDGSIVSVSLNSHRVCGPDGRALYCEGFIIDITERMRAEETIRENGDFLKEAQRIGDLGCYVLDIPTRVWSSSDELDELFGIDKDYDHTIAGWLAFMHPDDRARIVTHLTNEVVGKGETFDKEYRIIRQNDRAERWVHGMGRVEFDGKGKPIKMRGIIRDITGRRQAEITIRENEERFRETFEQAAVGIIHTSFDGSFLRCNARFAEIIGYPLHEIPGMKFQQITAPDDLANSVSVLHQMPSIDSTDAVWEKRYVRKDGSITWVRLTISSQRDAEGRAIHYIAVVEDINDRKTAEERLATTTEALRVSEERYRTAFHTSLDAIAINRLSDGTYTEVNQSFLDITGYRREELLGHTSLDLAIWAEPSDRLKMTDALRQHSVCRDLQVKFRRKDGTLIWGLMSASFIEVDGVPCVLSVTRDVSDSKAAEEQIAKLAFYDTLTHLPNRHLLMERLQKSLSTSDQNGRKRALLIVDLDDFKTVNDTIGHPTGDLILQEVARRLASLIREPDSVARMGGDEFVVILEQLSVNPAAATAQAEAVGNQILSALAKPYLLAGRECRSTSCIGITVFAAQSESNDVLQKADIALDQAKAAGPNSMRFFAPALQVAVNARAAMEEDLYMAIKDNQFVLHYQPQLDSSHLIGAEALIRWNHPARGLLFPDSFIPLAEQTGLILPLGQWVLENACAQIAVWQSAAQTSTFTVSVNISARQFRQPDFVEQVLAVLNRTGADPRLLELELTESLLVENVKDVIAKMSRLKGCGVRFSLDDFGTGYSSLAYLKRMPLDQLKIDRTFVRDILVDDTSGAIAQTIISLSRAMGLSVIAEGVETETQRDFLDCIGCHCFQGYLFSRPLPLEEFEPLWLDSAAVTLAVCK
jgi:diguanylate cyclase (GGDEF)-like protein/PAS domain S-box-containing protein